MLADADSAAAARTVADEYWAACVQRYPEIATYQGMTAAPHDRLTDNSLAAVAAWRLREDAWHRRVRELVPRLAPGSDVAISPRSSTRRSAPRSPPASVAASCGA